MKIITLLFLVAGLLLSSCLNDPKFPSRPHIELLEYSFLEVTGSADTLKVKVSFEDGEGDLGLGANEEGSPYNLLNYYNNKTGQVIDFSAGPISVDDLMTLKDRQTIDTLPPFEDPFKCTRWDTEPDLFFNDSTQLKDTVYFQFNQRHYNFFVEFFVKENGEFIKFDFREQSDCGVPFHGRFPLLDDDNASSPKEGEITYNMQSQFFLAFFENETLKLRIKIADRAGNFSDPVMTDEFTLRGIQAN